MGSAVVRIVEVSATVVLLLLVALLVVLAVTGEHLLLTLVLVALAIVGEPLATVGFGHSSSGEES